MIVERSLILPASGSLGRTGPSEAIDQTLSIVPIKLTLMIASTVPGAGETDDPAVPSLTSKLVRKNRRFDSNLVYRNVSHALSRMSGVVPARGFTSTR